jgi:putative phosphoesterase
MQVAVLADVHGNLPALRAVLTEVDRERVDALVVAGDVVAGAYPREALELLAGRPEPVVWVRGNAEREAVAAWDGAPTADDPGGRAAVWSARGLDRQWRDRLNAWPIAAVLDGIRYCHGSPRRDDEVLTRATPDAVLRDALRAVDEPVVVGGHTHQQFVRELSATPTYINAGSVGMPYEGRPGAFWLLMHDRRPQLRATAYDLDGAVAELRRSGFGDVEEQISESLIDPVDADWVTAFFEHGAGRGPHPGPPTVQAPPAHLGQAATRPSAA